MSRQAGDRSHISPKQNLIQSSCMPTHLAFKATLSRISACPIFLLPALPTAHIAHFGRAFTGHSLFHCLERLSLRKTFPPHNQTGFARFYRSNRSSSTRRLSTYIGESLHTYGCFPSQQSAVSNVLVLLLLLLLLPLLL